MKHLAHPQANPPKTSRDTTLNRLRIRRMRKQDPLAPARLRARSRPPVRAAG